MAGDNKGHRGTQIVVVVGVIGAMTALLLIAAFSSAPADNANVTIGPTHAIETVWRQNWEYTETALVPARATHYVTMTAGATTIIELYTANAKLMGTYYAATRYALQTLNALPTATPIPRSAIETWNAIEATSTRILATAKAQVLITHTARAAGTATRRALGTVAPTP